MYRKQNKAALVWLCGWENKKYAINFQPRDYYFVSVFKII
jgi:hypothetical protein